jgi:hypothetical protein
VAIVVGVVDTAGRYLFPVAGAFMVYAVFLALVAWRRDGVFVPRGRG